MHGILDWLEKWSQRRAEKNRRFKIPRHLGVGRTGLNGMSKSKADMPPATAGINECLQEYAPSRQCSEENRQA